MKHIAYIFLLSLVLFLCPRLGSGQEATGSATLSWTPPTQNTDGSELTNLAGYKIYYGTSQSGPYDNVIEISNPNTTTYVVENLAEGTWYFVSTAVNSQGIESEFSNEASKTIEAAPVQPNPPVLTVAGPVAYDFLRFDDIIRLVAVGEVEVGTPCDSNYSVNGKYVVPRAAVVRWYDDNTRPAAIVAECS